MAVRGPKEKALIWWDAAEKKWTGHDNAGFHAKANLPITARGKDAKGDDGIAGDKPFTLHSDGMGWIWVTSGLKDGPLPTHYEPLETPVKNVLYPDHETNPAAEKKISSFNDYAFLQDQRFPFVLTTYRLTEHHTAGGMSRGLPHLAELQPELFCELSPELAKQRDLVHGDYVTVVSPRGIIEARVMITNRMHPVPVEGRMVHQVGLPYHWGSKGIATGDSVNDLLAISEEPNVRIMETKALVCNIFPGRRPRGPAALNMIKDLMRETA